MLKLPRPVMAGLVLLALSGTLAAVQQGTALASAGKPAGSSHSLATPPRMYYAAMGDSYSAGEGVTPYYPDNNTEKDQCRRSEHAYATLINLPGQSKTIAQEAAAGDATFKFVACFGAQTTDITGDAVYNANNSVYRNNAGEVKFDDANNTDWGKNSKRAAPVEGRQVNGGPDNVDVLNDKTTLVTLTIGGNDARFADIMTACVLHACAGPGFTLTRGNGAKDLEPLVDEEPKIIGYLKAHLEATFLAIHKAAPLATILVAGYPLLFPSGLICRTSIRTFSRGMVWMLNNWGTTLDNTTANAVLAVRGRMSIKYVNPIPAFTGHSLCAKDPWVIGLKLTATTTSFHPNEAGQVAYAKLFDACLADLPKCDE